MEGQLMGNQEREAHAPMQPAIQSYSKLILALSASLFFSPFAIAADAQPAPVPAKSKGILPLPDYSGDFRERPYLFGDIGGTRTEWAEMGLMYDISYNQYLQSVVNRGSETGTRYGGTIDYNVTLDFDRMGVIPGGILTMRAVSRYGRSVNGISGAGVPVNTDATHPTTSVADDEVTLYLPVINYTQFLSQQLAVAFGKFDTYDSANEFAGGRGRSQWMNMNFALPVSPALIVPYSVMGASVVVMPTPNLTIIGMVATSEDTSSTSGFDEIDDGKFALVSLTYQYELKALPGGFGHMFGYGWDSDFHALNSRLGFASGRLQRTTQNYTWFSSHDIWQYLWVEGDSEQKVNISNGQQDLQGVGVFSRLQFADEDTNPLDYIFTAGVCSKGLIPDRDNDTTGIAFNYNRITGTRLGNVLGVDRSASVWEGFYNIQLTPAVHWTLDAQVSDSALPNTGTAVILGTQLQLRF
jgi:porin